MPELFVAKTEEELAQMVAVILAETYGTVSVHGTTIEFSDVTPPADSVITATRGIVISQLNAAAIKEETRRRIYDVMQDDITQTNINAWALDVIARQQMSVSGDNPTEQELADLVIARGLTDWVRAMRDVSRELVGAEDPTYTSNSHWPSPPGGWEQFVDNF